MASKRCQSNHHHHNNNDDHDDNPTVERQKKHPKLPLSVASRFAVPSSVTRTVEEFARDRDTIRIYSVARRFEKHLVEPKSNDDDDDDDDEEKTPRATEFVEFYYDTNSGTDTDNKLKTVKGEHWRWFRHNEEEEAYTVFDNNNNDDDDSTLTESPVPNSWYVRPAPTVQFSSSMKDTQTLALHVHQLAQELQRDGFQEVPKFLELHKRHLPCFTWIVNDDDDTSTSTTTDPLGSRIGGSPAMYPDEEWPSRQKRFVFQINLARVPRRMQCITGSSGLLQLFWGDDDQMDGYGRVVPATDLDKLVVRPDLSPRSSHRDEAMTNPLVPGTITGWVERADYPLDHFDNYELSEKSRDLHCGFNKFGGFANYAQDAEPWGACSCGASHLGREETFHFCGNSILRFMSVGMNGQLMYCPNNAKKCVIVRCSCD